MLHNKAAGRIPKRIKRRFAELVLLLVISILAFSYAFPLYWMITTSLKHGGDVFKYPPQWFPDPITLTNYVELRKLPLVRYIGNSSFITVVATFGQVFASSIVAFGFARLRSRYRDMLFLVVVATMLLPWPVLMIPTFITFYKLRWLDTFLPLTLPHYLGGGAFNIFLLRQFMRTIPLDLDEAARLEGANSFQIYSRIILPLSKPALATVAVFGFVAHWNDFLGPLIYLNRPERRTLALALHVTLVDHFRIDWAFMMALATVAVLPTVVLYFFAQKYFVQQLQLSGLKE
jgi:ABC-type glycerol-3-phosphate transport system permease component